MLDRTGTSSRDAASLEKSAFVSALDAEFVAFEHERAKADAEKRERGG